ncbi:MAG: hypothetical protein AMS25_13635 [Gemmatimonas sp. SM23_52]|nr:MAG: hypothetical protein AMS25_13635 [Gemmatimonas sp. SM23_52]
MEPSALNPTRREFLGSVLPVGALTCLGCKKLCGLFGFAGAQQATAPHKFLADSQMSFAEVFDFGFKGFYIPILQSLGAQMGEDDYIELLKAAATEAGRRGGENWARSVPNNDFATFKSWATDLDRFWEHALTFEIVEDTDQAFEVKVTECLWAKTFREAQAGEIGYATVCYQDYASAEGFNPKLSMVRTKTLMQGDDCCNHRWLWEG